MTTDKNKRRSHFLIRKKRREKALFRLSGCNALSRNSASPAKTRPGGKEQLIRKPYDPELLFVECGRCGAPVIWEEGKAEALLKAVGIDPLEIDPYCLLLTDGCPDCLPGYKYKVRMVRLGMHDTLLLPHSGNA